MTRHPGHVALGSNAARGLPAGCRRRGFEADAPGNRPEAAHPPHISQTKAKIANYPHNFPKTHKKKLPAEQEKQNEEIAKEFGITGYPSIPFLNAKGKKVGQMGYEAGGPAVWTKLADEQVAKAGKK